MKLVIKVEEKVLKVIMKRSRMMGVEMNLLECSNNCNASKNEAKPVKEIDVVAEEVVETKEEKPKRKKKSLLDKLKS